PRAVALNTILMLLTTAVLFSGLYAVATSRRHLLIGLAVFLPALVLGWLEKLRPSATIEVLELVFLILFFAYLAWMLLLHVLAARRVDVNIIFAAICVYMLVGFTCGYAYYLIELLAGDPTSMATFTGNVGIDLPRSESIYYSFVTLTTLGYGDIAPIASSSRAIAMVEALTGQVYLVTLMARLVSLQVAHSSQPQGQS
ncbi:MAG TPA: potassium channel family protein, partial [Gemmatimonadota bacterium]|nr:potassium channel family protein [Gemmatimonadota bacterium]